jgi:hypothetical protein
MCDELPPRVEFDSVCACHNFYDVVMEHHAKANRARVGMLRVLRKQGNAAEAGDSGGSAW